MSITPCYIQVCLIGRDDAGLARILDAPLVKAFLLQVSADMLRTFGYRHPMGEDWRGYQDINPATLTRERIVEFLDRVDPESILAIVPHGTPKQVAHVVKDYVDAGLRVPKILDYGAMAGLSFAAASADAVRETEDELLSLCGDVQ
jgi:phthiodiolone/phenolphthiodiolone dimycocerosates ketoreductase